MIDLSLFDSYEIFFSKTFCRKFPQNLQKFEKIGRKRTVEIVDLVENIPTRIWSSKSASILRRTDSLSFQLQKQKWKKKKRKRDRKGGFPGGEENSSGDE